MFLYLLACVLLVDKCHQRMVIAEAHHVEAGIPHVGFLGDVVGPVLFPVMEVAGFFLDHVEVLDQRAGE